MPDLPFCLPFSLAEVPAPAVLPSVWVWIWGFTVAGGLVVLLLQVKVLWGWKRYLPLEIARLEKERDGQKADLTLVHSIAQRLTELETLAKVLDKSLAVLQQLPERHENVAGRLEMAKGELRASLTAQISGVYKRIESEVKDMRERIDHEVEKTNVESQAFQRRLGVLEGRMGALEVAMQTLTATVNALPRK